MSLAVLASAQTEAEHHEDLGCSIQGPASRAVRHAHAPLRRALAGMSEAQALRSAKRLIRDLEATPAYAELCVDGSRRAGRRVLREEVLFPKASKHPPRFLHLRQGELGFDLPVRAAEWSRVGAFLAELAGGMSSPRLHELASQPPLNELCEALLEAGWLEPSGPRLTPPNPGALFVGHNSVVVTSGKASVWVDPYFRPASSVDLPAYQPLQPRDLPPPSAVLITHSHGDHFHLGSLVQLPRETRFFVPATRRESLFSTDCALRLQQLGFKNVESIGWGERRVVGELVAEALPFYGEQPTSKPGVYPGLFNDGNTWVVRAPRFSAAFLADAGKDARGDMAKVCRASGRRAPVDVLFCGIRGFRLRPLFYGATTLEAFLVNASATELTVPQRLMASPSEALRYGALLGAAEVVPCADGGAPWYWREGMGPKYPGYPGVPVPGASTREENPDADPFPERLVEARRRLAAGPVARVLRPGDGLCWRPGKTPLVKRYRGFTWPFGAPDGPARRGSPGGRGKPRRGR